MSGVFLPVFIGVAVLLFLAGLAAVVAGPRLAKAASLGLCALGALLSIAYLLAGAPPAALAVPVGPPGQSVVLTLDGLSGFFLVLVMASGAAAALAAFDTHDYEATAPAFPVFLAGMTLTLIAGDAFPIVAGFELMSLASFVLVLTNHRDQQVRAAGLLYMGMAAFGGVCVIAALALLGTPGAGFAVIRAHPPEGWRATLVLVLALAGAGSKAGLAPLHVWLPPAHAAAPAHVSALMSGAMTKVALYVLVRVVFDLCGPAQPLWWGLPLIAMGVAGAVIGALRANLEPDMKSVLACSTVENVGLVAIGLGLGLIARASDLSTLAGLALGAALLHAMAHGLFKSLLFLGAGAVQHGAGTRVLARLGGVIQRMPFTGAAMLLGAACLAGLPPSAGFAGEWTLFQAAIGSVRLGGIGLQILACLLTATLALATSLGAAAAVRLIGVALLGRPRTPRAAGAEEAGPPMRWALILLGLAVALVGLFPSAVLALAEPGLRILAHASMRGRAEALSLLPQADAPGYVPLGVVALLSLAALGTAWVLRLRAVAGYRTGPAWDCGFGAPPAWLPFGDPATQYAGGSFAQPLRRMLGVPLLGARETVDMPEPGDTRPAGFGVTTRDPAQSWVFDIIGAVRVRLSDFADWLLFLTVRQTLSVIFAALVAFLALVAVLEQS